MVYPILNTSKDALEFLIGWEALRLKAYLDQAGKWTIGIGHLLTPKERESGRLLIGEDLVKWRDGLTRDQACALKQQDLERFEFAVSKSLDAIKLKQHEFDALVILAYNIGDSAFAGSSLVRCLRLGDRNKIVGSWLAWNKVTVDDVRMVSRGLVKRRKAEVQIFLNADYSGRP